MAFYKNKASQLFPVYAVDSAGAAKTGDAANITGQISKNGGASAATDDTNPTELDATNHPGVYLFTATQAETNADLIVVTGKSTTSGVTMKPLIVHTEPEVRKATLEEILGTALTEDATGWLAAGLKKLLNVASPEFTLSWTDTAIQTILNKVDYMIEDPGDLGDYRLSSDALRWIVGLLRLMARDDNDFTNFDNLVTLMNDPDVGPELGGYDRTEHSLEAQGINTLTPATPSAGSLGNAVETVIENLDAPVSGRGTGTDQCTMTITSDGSPVADALVWVTTDDAGANVVAGSLSTDDLGQVMFLLEAGVIYYLWARKSGMNPIEGEAFEAEADA